MDGRGRLAEPVTDGAPTRPAAGAAPASRARPRAFRWACSRGRLEFAARSAPLRRADRALAAAARRRHRRRDRASAGERRLRRRARRPSAGGHGRTPRLRATPPPTPRASASPRSRSPASASSAARRSRHRRRHRADLRCCSSTPARRGRGSRPIPGSPKRRCSSSIPGRLQIAVTERDAFALWQQRRQGRGDRRRRHRGRALSSGRISPSCRWWSGAAPRPGPRTSSRCSTGIPRSATSSRRRPGRRAALEPRAQERHRRAAAGSRRRAGARHAGRSSTATTRSLTPRHRRDRSAAAGPGDRAAVGRGRARRARGAQGQEAEEEGRRRMTPPLRPHPEDEAGVAAALGASSPRSTSAPARSSA